jgi:hypothetical protein
MRAFFLYHNGQQLNSLPMTRADVDEVMKHKTITKIKGRQGKAISTSDIRVVERIIF